MDTPAARRGCSGAKSWGVAALPIKIKHSLTLNFVSLQGQECRYFTASISISVSLGPLR